MATGESMTVRPPYAGGRFNYDAGEALCVLQLKYLPRIVHITVAEQTQQQISAPDGVGVVCVGAGDMGIRRNRRRTPSMTVVYNY